MSVVKPSAASRPVFSRGKRSFVAPALRLFYAACGGNFLYVMLLLNFSIYEFSLGHYAYRVTPNLDKIPLAMMMISALAGVLAFSVTHHRSLVGLFSHICFAMLFVPLCAVYTLLDGATTFVLSCGAALALCFLLFGRRASIVLNMKSSFDRLVLLLFGAISILVLAGLAVQGHLSFSFVPFREVYALRSSAQLGDGPAAERFVTISAYTATSYLLIHGIFYRNIITFLLGAIGSYALYCTFGLKLFLFFPPLVIAIYIYMTMRNSYVFILIIILMFIFIKFFNTTDLSQLSSFLEFLNEIIIRRYFYVPGFLAFSWYETFLEEPFVFMSNVFILNKLLIYPFDISYSSVVALRVFGVEFNPNTNFMVYGFANFGYLGIFLFAVVTFWLLSIVDRISARIESAYLALGAAAPATLFLEADPVIVVISFGFGVVLLVCIAGQLIVGRQREAVVSSGLGASRTGNPL